MPEYDDTNRIALWRNEKKESKSHPDLTGSGNVDGVEYWASAWKGDTSSNAKAPILKISLRPKDESREPGGNGGQRGGDSVDDFLGS